MTAVEWLDKELWSLRLQLRGGEISIQDFGKQEIKLIEQAKQLEKQQIIEDIIGFQLYLYDQGYITNHDWNFVKEAIYYLH